MRYILSDRDIGYHMTKKELCEVIAQAYFPKNWKIDCPDRINFIKNKMKCKKEILIDLHEKAMEVLEDRNKNA